MECMGGRERYVQKLDSMFSNQYYWHGNEPCHQVAYMYNYAGEPWKTQKTVRRILDTEYKETPSGLAGNDDAGQMSAWYIFSAMGFYPVCPGTTRYELASPTFDKVVVSLENGRQFCIKVENASPENIYVQEITRNGEPYTATYIDHEDIVNGATFRFRMGATRKR